MVHLLRLLAPAGGGGRRLTAPRGTRIATARGASGLADWALPLPLDEVLPRPGPWEVEIGFGKGAFLRRSARARPETRFLGIEVANEYFALAARRIERDRAANVVLVRGEALFLLATVLPARFATTLHVYFPDPWPKSRHLRRRLFAQESIDLLARALVPGGELDFATDFTRYGEEVAALLAANPAFSVRRIDAAWPDGARTNYEAKYVREGRAITRLVALRSADDVAPPARELDRPAPEPPSSELAPAR